MRGSHVAAAIAFLLAARCLPIPQPADAAGPVTAWYMQGAEWVPIASFDDADECAREARPLAAKSGTYVACAAGTPPHAATPAERQRPASLDDSFNAVVDRDKPDGQTSAPRRPPSRQGHPSIECSITGLSAVCKSY